jgi:hypothetical protein
MTQYTEQVDNIATTNTYTEVVNETAETPETPVASSEASETNDSSQETPYLLYDPNSKTPYPITPEQVELVQTIEAQQMEYHHNKDTGDWQLVKDICTRSRETDIDNPLLIDYLETDVFDTVIQYGDVKPEGLYKAIQYTNHETSEYFSVDGPEMLHFLDNFHIPYPVRDTWPVSVVKDILFRNTPQPNCNISLYVFTPDVIVCIGHAWMTNLDNEYCMIVPRHPSVDVGIYE